MSKALPLELKASILSSRIMAVFVGLCGVLTIIGIPWSILFFLVAIFPRNKKLVKFAAYAGFPLWIFILPIFFNLQLWRLYVRLDDFDSTGSKHFISDKKWKQKRPWDKYPYLAMSGSVMLIIIVLFLPITITTSRLVDLDFVTQYTQDNTIELGETQTREQGTKGQGLERQRYTSPLFTYIFGSFKSTNYKTEVLPTQITQAPVNRVVAQGTKRYQYMWCSNGSYRYYTNEQFQNKSVGFTHKSPDACSQNAAGNMTGLYDTAPPPQTTQTIYKPSYTPLYNAPTYTTCHSYSYSNDISCTTY